MKKIILCCAAVIFINYFSYNQTIIPGGTVSGTWHQSASPYYVAGSVMIPNDSTLTIEPGVKVIFENNYQLQVNGRLLAIGKGTDTIIFTASQRNIGWQGIRFPSTATSNDSSKFVLCKFEYGFATGTSSFANGGALCFTNFSKAIISHSVITNCRANFNGGGIYCEKSNIIITNNVISNNTANKGGGIYNIECSPLISNNTIFNNSAGPGGGIHSYYSNSIISNNLIFNNSASKGGGIYCFTCSALISNNTISNNSAGSGCGIYIEYHNPIISNNIITNNSDKYNNSYGGAISCYSSNPSLYNNTLANNGAIYGGALYCEAGSKPTFENCIVWGNTASQLGAQVYLNDEACDPNFSYCDVQGGTSAFELNGNFYTGIYKNNIDTDPLFVAPSGGSGTGYNGLLADWSLQNCSPCLNSGNPAPLYTYPLTDILGNIRVTGGRIDMGAYENQKALFVSVNINANPSGPICTGTNVTFTSTIKNAGSSPSFQWKLNGKSVSTDSTFASSLLANNDTVTCVLISSKSDTCVIGNPAISNAISMIVNQFPSSPIITQIPTNILYSSASTGNQWYNDSGIIIGATSQKYTPPSDGNYYVIVTVNGCSSNKSNVFNFVSTGIFNNSLNVGSIVFYPNPVSDYLNIETSKYSVIEILNIQGQIIKSFNNDDIKTIVDLANLSNGIYIIRAITDKKIVTKKFIKE